MKTRILPSIQAEPSDFLTLADLRDFIEATPLHPGESKVRVKLVPFKEMSHADGQPIKSLAIDYTP